MSLTSVLIAAALHAAAPTALLANEKSWFHIPGVADFRIQAITNSGHEKDWPFSVDAGSLLCAYVTGRPVVYFTDAERDDGTDGQPRIAMVSTNPIDLGIANMSAGGLVRRDLTIQALIAAMGPFEAMGKRLCDQPPGAKIGPGEL